MFKLLKKNKNYKLVIGLIIGLILSSSVIVYAWYNDLASEVSYDPSNTWLHSTTVQDALDELVKQKDCPVGYSCLTKKNTLSLGDYVSYTPVKTSYTINVTYTGATIAETINPSELNLWRVLSINGDGTVDIISENVSSSTISFRGQTGYKNLVGYLNVLASQYETSGITVGSRYFGYNGQTEFITNTQYFVNPAPWTCSTGGTCTPDPDDYESYGGGDTLYLNDYNLVNTVLGTCVANTVGTSNAAYYWIASRHYNYTSATYYEWNGRHITWDNGASNLYLYAYSGNTFGQNIRSNSLRPIVTLKSGLTYSGVGNKDYPMEIVE